MKNSEKNITAETLFVRVGLVICVFLVALIFMEARKQYKESKFKYDITISLGRCSSHKYTNSYSLDNGCLKFKDSNNDSVIICGDYTIIKQ